jgi:hypothetical protein
VYDADEENRRFARDAELKRNDWARRQAEEDVAGGRSRRSATGTSESSYDDEYYRSRGSSNGYDSRGYEQRRY